MSPAFLCCEGGHLLWIKNLQCNLTVSYTFEESADESP